MDPEDLKHLKCSHDPKFHGWDSAENGCAICEADQRQYRIRELKDSLRDVLLLRPDVRGTQEWRDAIGRAADLLGDDTVR